MSTFPEKLAELMKAKRYNKSTLGKALNVTHSTVSRWLAGSIPNEETANSLARILGVSAQWLISGDGPNTVNDDTSPYGSDHLDAEDALIRLASTADTKWLVERLEVLMDAAAAGDRKSAAVAKMILPIVRDRIPGPPATSLPALGQDREKTA